jgi:acylphosphatase
MMQNAPQRCRVHLRIEGRVQGVYFRASTVAQAQSLGATGWVRNCPDGSVEVAAEGTRASIDRLIEWCHRGPDGARVSRVQVEWEEPQNNFAGFGIRR